MEFEQFYSQFERLAMDKAFNYTQDPHHARSIADDAILRAWKYRGSGMEDIPLVVMSVKTLVSKTSKRNRFADSLVLTDGVPELPASQDYELRIDIRKAMRGGIKAFLGIGYTNQYRVQIKQRVLKAIGD